MPQFIETALFWLGELHCRLRHKKHAKVAGLKLCATCHRIKGNP